MTLILGLESSCDDTAVAVVRNGVDVLSNVVSSQDELHARFAGVVPEIASRAHLERIIPVVELALEKAGTKPCELGAVAVANRPGLVGGLIVAVSTAKALSAAWDKPLITVSHIAAHLYAGVMACPDWHRPAIALTASGGHTLLCLVEGPREFKLLGRTIDDAGGEAFDKGANLLGMPGQGGAALDRLAKSGDPRKYRFPRPLKGDSGHDFSFAGLKTALLYEIFGPGGNTDMMPVAEMTQQRLADLAASYQEAICDVLATKALRAAEEYSARTLFVTGGVAANSRLREILLASAGKAGVDVVFPPLSLCTDNAAMIAGLAFEHYRVGGFSDLECDAAARSVEQGKPEPILARGQL